MWKATAKQTKIRVQWWLLVLCIWQVAASSPSSNGMVLRIRLGDGSMERIQVPPGAEDTMTLKEILSPFSDKEDAYKVQIGTSETINVKKQTEELEKTLAVLGLKHGSLLTLLRPAASVPSSEKKKSSYFATPIHDRFDPFPSLAKDYEMAVRLKARRTRGMSYSDIAHVQSALHIVEPQSEGSLKRVYICRHAAERFQANGIVKKEGGAVVQPRVGLLLGTVQRERVNLKPVKARTSLSSSPSDQDFCQVAKVQALWEPPQSPKKDTYDASGIVDHWNGKEAQRVVKVASWLGLRPVGWIFSYTDARGKEEDSLPVWGANIVHGATIQSNLMQSSLGRSDGMKCVTLAMDGNEGATEAFQLSDVSVQMVVEGMFGDKPKAERMVTMQHEILVDGKETTTLDSVLCLVNTAMLSHEGAYASSHNLKKNGSLTKKTKKSLLKAMDKDQTDHCSLLNALSDFNVLLALDQLLPPGDSEALCGLARKWVRGQRRGTEVGSKLLLLLKSVLTT